MFREMGGRPNDQRGFLHKSFVGKFVGGAFKKLVSSTPIGAAVTTAVSIGSSAFGRSRSRGQQAQKQLGRDLKFGNGANGPPALAVSSFPMQNFGPRSIASGPRSIASTSASRAPCDFPMEIAPDGSCREPTVDQFGRPLGVGAAVMGRYGPALEPGSKIIDRAVCLPGMQLGNDGFCYDKAAITNKQRMWPAGRKPLLTGGEMGAITIANRAARRLEGATKRLQRMGMMKKAAPRRHPALRIPVHKSVDV